MVDDSLHSSEQASSSATESSPHPRHKKKLKDEKVCGVCGDRALGYNFNAITCESCKAFFRRNALKEKSMKCLFENKCVVDIRTRRFCPACRIKKCFSIGMNKDMILDESERKKRMNKASKLKRDSSSPSSSNPLLAPVKQEPIDHDTDPIDIHRPSTPFGKPHGEDDKTIFNHVPEELLPLKKEQYHSLSHEDSQILNSVTKAYKATLAAMPEVGPYTEEKEYQNAADLVNHSELVVRKLIVFVKHLTEFRSLTQEDQIAALKSCVMNSLLLRSALFYMIEKDAWVTAKGEIPSKILRETTGFASIHNDHVYYCQRMKSMAQMDYNIYALLQALIVFDPSGETITHRDYVSKIQDQYMLLLKHYLESRFSYRYAKEYFVSVMDRLCDLRQLSEEHAKILLQVNPVQIEPLMLEVLNLK